MLSSPSKSIKMEDIIDSTIRVFTYDLEFIKDIKQDRNLLEDGLWMIKSSTIHGYLDAFSDVYMPTILGISNPYSKESWLKSLDLVGEEYYSEYWVQFVWAEKFGYKYEQSIPNTLKTRIVNDSNISFLTISEDIIDSHIKNIESFIDMAIFARGYYEHLNAKG